MMMMMMMINNIVIIIIKGGIRFFQFSSKIEKTEFLPSNILLLLNWSSRDPAGISGLFIGFY